jgi:hypothetical protein
MVAMVRAQQAQPAAPSASPTGKRREPAYLATLEAWREQYFAMLLDVDRMPTPEQRARGLGRMRRYADDFEALAVR